MRVAILPSNQHQNQYAGMTVTEEKWSAATCAWLQRRLSERGVEAAIFHVPGAGAKSTDELSRMLAQAVAWKPDYMVSVHSDAVGDVKTTGILMLMCRELDRYEGIALGKSIALRVGLPFKGCWVWGNEARKINFLTTLRGHSLDGCLVEVGEHATVLEAGWNWRHVKEIGVGIADALAATCGWNGVKALDEEEEMTKDERNLLRIAAYRALAAALRSQAVIAELRGDSAKADALMAQADADVAKEKAKLEP